MAGRLAYIGSDHQVHVVLSNGSQDRTLTLPLAGLAMAPYGLHAPSAEGYLWPTWSPDGRWIACIQYPVSDEIRGPFQVHAVEADGIEQMELCQLSGEKPIYLQWSAMADALAMLVHGPNHVGLLHCRLDGLGIISRVESGVPLFFSWMPDDRMLLLHVGPTPLRRGQIILKDPLGHRAERRAVHAPGKFCAPVFVGGQAVFAIEGSQEGVSHVVVSDEPGRPERVLFTGKGLMAIVPSPSGNHIAVSTAPGGEHTPYSGIFQIELDSGLVRRVSSEDCLAFFWCPDGRSLLYAVVDPEENCIHWKRIHLDEPERSGRRSPGGDVEHPSERLASFWPTREYMFFLHFFDQYSLSHPVVSPDGRSLVYAGFPASRGQADLSELPRIFVLDTHHPEQGPVEVAEGTFASWDPTHPRGVARVF